MDKCHKYQQLISLYIDDMLSTSETEQLLEHLDECDDCYSFYIDLKKSTDELKNFKITCPENLHQTILDSISLNKNIQVVQYKQPKHKAIYISLATCACFALLIAATSFNFTPLSVDLSDELTEQGFTVDKSESNKLVTSEPQVSSIETSDPVRSFGLADDNSKASDTLDHDKKTHDDIFFDDYAFVFEFEGSKDLDETEGEVIYSDDKTTYISLENNIPVIEKMLEKLYSLDYIQLDTNHNDYKIDATSNMGIFILHKK